MFKKWKCNGGKMSKEKVLIFCCNLLTKFQNYLSQENQKGLNALKIDKNKSLGKK